MKRQVFIAVGIVVAIFVALAGVKGLQIGALLSFGKSFSPPPETIASAVAHEEQWHNSLFAVGSIVAEQGVVIAPEIAGKVSEIAFESGANVTQGDLLVKLDSAMEDAQLRAAEAQADYCQMRQRQQYASYLERIDEALRSQAELRQRVSVRDHV